MLVLGGIKGDYRKAVSQLKERRCSQCTVYCVGGIGLVSKDIIPSLLEFHSYLEDNSILLIALPTGLDDIYLLKDIVLRNIRIVSKVRHGNDILLIPGSHDAARIIRGYDYWNFNTDDVHSLYTDMVLSYYAPSLLSLEPRRHEKFWAGKDDSLERDIRAARSKLAAVSSKVNPNNWIFSYDSYIVMHEGTTRYVGIPDGILYHINLME